MASTPPPSDKVEPLSSDDIQWLDSARARARELADLDGLRLGANLSVTDLATAQEVYENFVYPKDTFEQQCLGVALGDVLASTTAFKWAVVTNEYGRRIALHDAERGVTLYPVTMVQNRVEDGREVNLPQLYRGLLADFGFPQPKN